jgi:hypothetical protein
VGDDACAELWLRELAPRAYRRPLVDADIARLMSVYSTAKADADFATGIRVVLQGILQSPWFLYHVELGDAAADVVDGQPVPLSGHELAVAAVLLLVGQHARPRCSRRPRRASSRTDCCCEAQVDRMLVDPKADEAVSDFHLQWLGLDELEAVEKDAAFYPDFDADLAHAMKDDTTSFVRWVFNEGDGRLETLLTGAFTLSHGPGALGRVRRGATGRPRGRRPDGAARPRARGRCSRSRGGWPRHAHANQSSPVHRGQLVRERLLMCGRCRLRPRRGQRAARPRARLDHARALCRAHVERRVCRLPQAHRRPRLRLRGLRWDGGVPHPGRRACPWMRRAR